VEGILIIEVKNIVPIVVLEEPQNLGNLVGEIEIIHLMVRNLFIEVIKKLKPNLFLLPLFTSFKFLY
jgi:hypothetical protein